MPTNNLPEETKTKSEEPSLKDRFKPSEEDLEKIQTPDLDGIVISEEAEAKAVASSLPAPVQPASVPAPVFVDDAGTVIVTLREGIDYTISDPNAAKSASGPKQAEAPTFEQLDAAALAEEERLEAERQAKKAQQAQAQAAQAQAQAQAQSNQQSQANQQGPANQQGQTATTATPWDDFQEPDWWNKNSILQRTPHLLRAETQASAHVFYFQSTAKQGQRFIAFSKNGAKAQGCPNMPMHEAEAIVDHYLHRDGGVCMTNGSAKDRKTVYMACQNYHFNAYVSAMVSDIQNGTFDLQNPDVLDFLQGTKSFESVRFIDKKALNGRDFDVTPEIQKELNAIRQQTYDAVLKVIATHPTYGPELEALLAASQAAQQGPQQGPQQGRSKSSPRSKMRPTFNGGSPRAKKIRENLAKGLGAAKEGLKSPREFMMSIPLPKALHPKNNKRVAGRDLKVEQAETLNTTNEAPKISLKDLAWNQTKDPAKEMFVEIPITDREQLADVVETLNKMGVKPVSMETDVNKNGLVVERIGLDKEGRAKIYQALNSEEKPAQPSGQTGPKKAPTSGPSV